MAIYSITASARASNSRLPCRESCFSPGGNDHIDFESHKLRSNFRKTIGASAQRYSIIKLRPAQSGLEGLSRLSRLLSCLP
jgi:hypothetical protein